MADPLIVSDPAFLLTFGATLAILVVVPAATGREKPPERANGKHNAAISWFAGVRRSAFGMFAASLAAEALLFPIGALTFSRVTFAGIGLNFLAIPLMAVAQVAGMGVVPLAIVSRPIAAVAGWVAHVGAAGLVWSADLVRFAPAVTYRVAPPSWMAVTIYYSALLIMWLAIRRAGIKAVKQRRTTARASACIAAAAAIWILADPRTLVAAGGDGRLM